MFSEAAHAAGLSPGSLSGVPILWGLAVAVALFLSVLVHELAHSIYARRHGAHVSDITLFMIGGVSQISEPPRTGREEAVMALVGPLTSLALGAVCWGLFRALGPTGWFDGRFVAFQLAVLNLGLGLFNLLPAFPMDGGRVLRGLAAERWELLPATRFAAGAGRMFAIIFAIVRFLTSNFLLVVVAFFVYLGADAENRGSSRRRCWEDPRAGSPSRALHRSMRPPLSTTSVSGCSASGASRTRP
jgi:Zn-dependent protease